MSSIVAYCRRLLPSGVVFRVIRTLYYRGEWHACDRYFEADDCPHCDGPPYDESKLRAIKPQGLAWKLIDAARRGAAQDAASRGPSRRPSLDTFVVDEGGRAVWGTDARSACGDVGDVDMAASSRYSSWASSGRSSFSYLPTAGSIPLGGSPMSFLLVIPMSVDGPGGASFASRRSGGGANSVAAPSLAPSARHASKRSRRYISRSSSV